MSYPTLTLPKGFTWDYQKTPKFSNIKQVPQSGRHPAAATLQQGTIFSLELVYNYLKENGVTYSSDIAYLQEFYEAVGGGFNWFIFNPQTYNLDKLQVVSDTTQLRNGYMGTGDGVTTVWPLWRSTSALGGGVISLLERIQNIYGFTEFFLNGSPTGGVTVTNFPAVATFSTAPALGAIISWAGSYTYLCQFSDDTLDFNEFMYQLWELKSLKLETVNL